MPVINSHFGNKIQAANGLQIDRAAMMLSYCSGTALSVSELTAKMKGNREKTIALIRELNERSLLLSEVSREGSRGRPRHLLRTTDLGERFVNEYRQLLVLPLRCSDNDIKKVLHQADLARRIVERGISPYARFQEINELARNIANTAKAYQSTR